MKWTNQHLAGLLPQFLSEYSEDDAVTQLDASYAHGGGWRDFDGFKLTFLEGGSIYQLEYSGDRPMRQIASTKLRDEKIVLFEADWVAVIQPDGSFRVARMD